MANTIRIDRGNVTGSPNRLALLLGMLTNDGSVTIPDATIGCRSNFAMTRYAPLLQSPFKVSDKCCDVMKKKPAHDYEKRTGRKKYTGQMANESRLRRQKWMQNGCNAFESSKPTSNPLSFWTETDVLAYIKLNNVPYASVYGDIVEDGRIEKRTNGEIATLTTTGCKRTGCMFCMFGAHIKGDKRFVDMKQTHPKQYEYCMKSTAEGGLGLKAVIDWLNENVETEIKY